MMFSHPLIADAVARDATYLERARVHRRAAEPLAAEGARGERVAAHLHLTAPIGDQWVVGVLRAAAEEAMARGEARAAVGLLERALAEPPEPLVRPAVECELAIAEAASGSSRALDRVATSGEPGQDPLQRARTLQAVSRLLFARGEVGAAA